MFDTHVGPRIKSSAGEVAGILANLLFAIRLGIGQSGLLVGNKATQL